VADFPNNDGINAEAEDHPNNDGINAEEERKVNGEQNRFDAVEMEVDEEEADPDDGTADNPNNDGINAEKW
jgi:hypothetical protein